MDKLKIGVVIGSLRKESYSRKIANVLMGLAPESADISEIDISNIEMYNQDIEDEGRTPETWTDLRKSISEADAVIFVTPEYNRSVPAVLKNALDVGSRPYGQNSWNGKPGAVISISQGAISGFGANHHLRQTLVFLNVLTMQQPEAYIGNIAALFGADGKLNENTLGFLKKFMDSFIKWTETNLRRS